MFHLEYENELDYAQWSHRLLRLIWQAVVALFLTEILAMLGYNITGEITDYSDYVFRYILAPTGTCLLITGAMAALTEVLLRRGKFALQAYLFLTGTVLLCFVISFMHNYVVIAQALFAIPVMLALTYVDIKPILYATGLSIAGYLLFVVSINLYVYTRNYGTAPRAADVLANLAIIAVAALISIMVLRRQTELITLIHGAQHQTKLDSLTKLYNHGAFYEKLDEHIQRYNQDATPFHLILLDIDNFKAVNDQYGHDTGDTVLLALVRALRGNAGPEDSVFRYGGEEFAVLTTRSQRDTLRLAGAIRTGFTAATLLLETPLDITVSGGICCYSAERFGGRREFFAAADEALYHAKRTGKNKMVLWEEGLQSQCAGGPGLSKNA